MGIHPSYTRFGGSHADTAAAANMLAAEGLRGADGQPLSEALLLGIGGGLGAGYILWEFKAHALTLIVFGWRSRFNYPVEWWNRLCARLHVTPGWSEGGVRAADKALEAALASGRPALAWVDHSLLPYYGRQETLNGHIGHSVVVAGSDGDFVLVDDLAARPFRLRRAELRAARDRIPSYRNRLLTLTPGDAPDVKAAMRAGIADHIAALSDDSESFSLPVYRKWARLFTDTHNPKGWPQVFAGGRGLFTALCSLYEGIELFNTGGGGLRPLYAAFLEEAAVTLDQPRYREAAARYRELGAGWTRFAFDALDATPSLREARELMLNRAAALREKGPVGVMETRGYEERLALFEARYAAQPVLSPGESGALFAHLGDAMATLCNAEAAALQAVIRAAGASAAHTDTDADAPTLLTPAVAVPAPAASPRPRRPRQPKAKGAG